MMRLMLLSTLLWLVPTAAWAQFEIDGEGSLLLANDRTVEFDYGFSYYLQEGQYRFIVGRQSLNVPSVPQKYSLALILQQDKAVWVPDFINDPLLGFELTIDDYVIKLYQDDSARQAPGRFVVSLNGELFHFSRGPGQINFYFTEQGIKEVRVEGMFKPRR
ncbi:hypothetical protein [Arsukibacterium sp.]|uniref:hypothetical protein n=1 Tax=Arsukibacterium sp. TaxID=1977258 RepID=UPI002FD8E515